MFLEQQINKELFLRDHVTPKTGGWKVFHHTFYLKIENSYALIVIMSNFYSFSLLYFDQINAPLASTRIILKTFKISY